MKYLPSLLLIIILAFLLYSCTTIGTLRVKQRGEKCFSEKEIVEIMDIHNKSEAKLIITPIVVNSKQCIGLYAFSYDTQNKHYITERVLKFENKYCCYSREDKEANRKATDEFKLKYSGCFTTKEMEELTKCFRRGWYFSGIKLL